VKKKVKPISNPAVLALKHKFKLLLRQPAIKVLVSDLWIRFQIDSFQEF